MTMCLKVWVGTSLLLAEAALQARAWAQESPPADATKSGYTDTATVEGAGSVVDDLARDDLKVGSVFRVPGLDGSLKPWFDWKRQLNEELGLQLQLSYQTLYQSASESLTSEDEGFAGRFETQGMWTLLGRGTKNPGAASFRLEQRYRLGTDIPPSKLGSQFGSASLTGTGFSDFGLALTELAWRQTAADGNVKFGFGKISATSWYNGYALSGSKTGFQNSALQTSATKPTPGRGLGAVAGVRLGGRAVLIGGIHDANARTPDNPFDTIDEREFYYSAEFRWYPTTFENRRWDQVRVQLWHQDEREDAAVESSQGITFAASRLFDDSWMPFVVAGYSDGKASVMQTDVTGGVAFAFNTQHRAARDILAVAVNWGDPSDGALQEQLTAECFYRLQLLEHVAITPSVQFIHNPATSPGDSDVWVAGIRLRATF